MKRLLNRAGIRLFITVMSVFALVVSALASDSPTPIPTINYDGVQDALVGGFSDVITRAVTIIVAIIGVAIGLWGLLWIVRNAPRWFSRITGR